MSDTPPSATLPDASMTEALQRALAAFGAAPADPAADPLPLFVALFDAVRPRWRESPAHAAARYAALVAALEADAALAQALRLRLLRLLASRRLVGFFADSGILPPTGFFSELKRIVVHRLLPELPDETELQGCMQRVFHHSDDWVWLAAVPSALTQRFWHALAAPEAAGADEGGPLLRHVTDQMLEALLVLAYRVGGLGVEQEFGRFGPRFARHAQRVRGLAGAAQRFVDAYRQRWRDPAAPAQDEAELLVLVDQCVEVLDEARRASLQRGTTLHLTFLMRRTLQSLQRIETLARLLGARFAAERDPATLATAVDGWSDLIRAAIRAENQRNSLRQHLSEGVGLLARRVADNAAKTGEHYIAASRGEYFGMWRAAMGAGLIIAAMALLKIFASGASLAPAGYALVYSLIYGLGFVVIYMLHFTVATKQPAMTAQTVASYLDEARQGRGADIERLVDLVAAVARSQIAAILGNVLVALPTSMLVAWLWALRSGAPPLGEEKALHLLADLDPLSWAIPHAALAGVFLFLSGLLAGYFDNKASYARIGARVARLRWLRLLAGQPRAQRIGGYIEDHLGGLMGNFLFGCMLGSAGTVGLILGLPLDIRHVAFASANLGYALVALDFSPGLGAIAWAALGVALIGLTNLTVSFSLALWMALKARGIVFRQRRELLRRLWWRFKLQPSSFLLPRDDLDQSPA